MAQNIDVSIIPQSYLPEIKVSENDDSLRVIRVSIIDENGEAYTIPSGVTATFAGTKPSGLGFTVPCTIDGSAVQFVMEDTVCNEAGRFPAEIRLINGDARIGTCNVLMSVESNPHPDDTTDGDREPLVNEITALLHAIEEQAEQVAEDTRIVEQAMDAWTNMEAEATTLPAGSEASASYSDGVLSLGIPAGPEGAPGQDGQDGVGIANVQLNSDYTLTITLTDGRTYTTTSIRGEQGETGLTPDFSIGTVTTLAPGSQATATITGTDEEPVLNLGIPKGDTGEVSQAELDAVEDAVTDLKEDFEEITEETTTEDFDTDDNLVEGLTLSRDYYPNGANTPYSNASFSYLGIDVTGITKLKINGTHHIYTVAQFNALGVFLDSENTWIADVRAQAVDLSSFPIVVNVPNNATKLYLNTDYIASEYPSSLPSGLYVYPWRANVESIKVPYYALEKTPVALADLSDGNKKLKIIAGVIRNSGNGWEYINDSGHEPLNLTSVSVDSSGRLVINYGFTASKVLSLVATPDETFVGQYTIGGSVGLENSLFNVYSLPRVYGGMVRIDNGVADATSYATFTSAEIKTTGEIRLYHPSLSGVASKEVFNIQASSPNYEIKLGSQGFDYVSLYAYANGQKITDFTGLSLYIYAMRNVNALFINANNIVDAGGNFWIYGVMEI